MEIERLILIPYVSQLKDRTSFNAFWPYFQN